MKATERERGRGRERHTDKEGELEKERELKRERERHPRDSARQSDRGHTERAEIEIGREKG